MAIKHHAHPCSSTDCSQCSDTRRRETITTLVSHQKFVLHRTRTQGTSSSVCLLHNSSRFNACVHSIGARSTPLPTARPSTTGPRGGLGPQEVPVETHRGRQHHRGHPGLQMQSSCRPCGLRALAGGGEQPACGAGAPEDDGAPALLHRAAACRAATARGSGAGHGADRGVDVPLKAFWIHSQARCHRCMNTGRAETRRHVQRHAVLPSHTLTMPWSAALLRQRDTCRQTGSKVKQAGGSCFTHAVIKLNGMVQSTTAFRRNLCIA